MLSLPRGPKINLDEQFKHVQVCVAAHLAHLAATWLVPLVRAPRCTGFLVPNKGKQHRLHSALKGRAALFTQSAREERV